jgi:hypothetical protein
MDRKHHMKSLKMRRNFPLDQTAESRIFRFRQQALLLAMAALGIGISPTFAESKPE